MISLPKAVFIVRMRRHSVQHKTSFATALGIPKQVRETLVWLLNPFYIKAFVNMCRDFLPDFCAGS